MNDADAEILSEFVAESRENLDQLDSDFVALERDPSQTDRLAAIFRTVHTIKGTAGFLGFGRLEGLTHAGENLLSLLRDGTLVLTPAITTTLLELIDAVRRTLVSVEGSGQESEEDHTVLIGRLHAHVEAPAAVPGGSDPETPGNPGDPANPEDLGDEGLIGLEDPEGSVATEALAPPFPDHEAEPEEPAETQKEQADAPAGPADAAGQAPPSTVGTAAPSTAAGGDATPASPPGGPVPSGAAAGGPVPSGAAAGGAGAADAHPEPGGEHRTAESTVRIDVGLLDKLLNLVGELVLTRNQVLQYGAHAMDPGFLPVTQRLNLLTTELQEGVMKTRMRPIGSVWNKLPRLVRDTALTCGKEVTLDTEGSETELDRTIIEAINDPLIHLVRNAIDHGIETPATRVEAGKPPTGRLMLRAFHEGGQVHLEVSDDGAGIDVEAIRRKAVDRGIATPDRAAGMSEKELTSLIFHPGFSTAKVVSNVSGRGVGLDVVRANIERIGGMVDLQTRPGAGTTIRVKIPLTLAIIPVLLVDWDGKRFAIPQVNLLELVRLEGGQLATAIETIQGAPFYRLRGNLLPLVHLGKLLDLPDDEQGRSAQEMAYIVVLQADSRPFGLIVDGVSDTEEIVVKSLDKSLKRLAAYGGATILGDGSVALILDVHGIAQRGSIVSGGGDGGPVDLVGEALARDEDEPMLLVAVGDNRLAVPLASVARLEEIPVDAVENAGGQDVVQYRGQILPLIHLRTVLDGGSRTATDARGDLQVVVYTEEAGSVGFVVDKILDVIAEPLAIRYRSARRGVLGSVVLQGKVTELLDVHGAIRAVNPKFFDQESDKELVR